MTRGEVWWARLPRPVGSEPGFNRPVVIIQSDRFNRSQINTLIAAAVTRNLRLRAAPGNVYLPSGTAGLEHASVINVSQLVTLDRRRLLRRMGSLVATKMHELDEGLRLALPCEGAAAPSAGGVQFEAAGPYLWRVNRQSPDHDRR